MEMPKPIWPWTREKIICPEKASRGAFTGWRKIPDDADHARYRWFYPIDWHVLV